MTAPGRDAIIYKMHGDAQFPSEAVLTKDDYETYECIRSLFRTALKGDMISKTFLFIGFSFDDLNLDYVLSQIHSLVGENKRDHYFFLRRLKKTPVRRTRNIHTEWTDRNWEEDLRRYGIQAVMIDDYREITDMLKKNRYCRKNEQCLYFE